MKKFIKQSKADTSTATNCYQGLKSFFFFYEDAKRLYYEQDEFELPDALYNLKHSFCTLIAANLIHDCYDDRIKSILDRADHLLEMADKKSEKSCEKKFCELQDELYNYLAMNGMY